MQPRAVSSLSQATHTLTCRQVWITVSPNPSTATHLNGLVPKGGVREVVPVDLIGCGVYVDGSHHLERYATLWKKKTDCVWATDMMHAWTPPPPCTWQASFIPESPFCPVQALYWTNVGPLLLLLQAFSCILRPSSVDGVCSWFTGSPLVTGSLEEMLTGLLGLSLADADSWSLWPLSPWVAVRGFRCCGWTGDICLPEAVVVLLMSGHWKWVLGDNKVGDCVGACSKHCQHQ